MSKTVKLFIGYPITSDIRMHLKQSASWKQAKITTEKGSRDMQETHFQDKEYIGRYVNAAGLTLDEIKHIELSMHAALTHYCPELPNESLKIYVFPQIFIS